MARIAIWPKEIQETHDNYVCITLIYVYRYRAY